MDFERDAPHWHITSDTVLHELWCRLMGDGGFDRRSLWLVFLDADAVTLPVVVPVDDVPPRPEGLEITNLFRLVESMRDDGIAAFAPLLARPGPAAMTADDRAWGVALTRIARERDVAMWPVHLATHGRVQPMAAAT